MEYCESGKIDVNKDEKFWHHCHRKLIADLGTSNECFEIPDAELDVFRKVKCRPRKRNKKGDYDVEVDYLQLAKEKEKKRIKKIVNKKRKIK